VVLMTRSSWKRVRRHGRALGDVRAATGPIVDRSFE